MAPSLTKKDNNVQLTELFRDDVNGYTGAVESEWLPRWPLYAKTLIATNEASNKLQDQLVHMNKGFRRGINVQDLQVLPATVRPGEQYFQCSAFINTMWDSIKIVLWLSPFPTSNHLLRDLNQAGHWLPSDYTIREKWLAELEQEYQLKSTDSTDPILQHFEKIISKDDHLRFLAHKMFDEVPDTPPYNKDPTGHHKQVRDFHHALELIDLIMTQAPQWFATDDPASTGLVGFPINAILDWPMNTPSGSLFFRHPIVNDQLGAILSKWSRFLTSPASTATLNSNDGWLSPRGLEELAHTANAPYQTDYTFAQLYACPGPSLHFYGFRSWDAFFTRQFNPGIRPVASSNDDAVIVSACESAPLHIQRNVNTSTVITLKDCPYALGPMLGHLPQAALFEGGTVYQAFLSALSYHRWHAAVSGTIAAVKHIPGSYYACVPSGNFEDPDPSAPNRSQVYLTQVATRAVILIEADNAAIGLVGFVAVGMAEVSSCEVSVRKGQRVRKGEELGMFRYGGSTWCLVLRKEARALFDEEVEKKVYEGGENVPVNGVLASVIEDQWERGKVSSENCRENDDISL